MNWFMLIVSCMIALTPLPHIYRMWRSGSARDQSLLGSAGVTVGVACWLAYGWHTNEMTVAISNAVILATNLLYTGTTAYYRYHDRKAAAYEALCEAYGR
jgi:MtN3 and saliva related transmembrane protein